MNHRRAFTLVELLVSISVGSVLMALALGLVHRSMLAQSAAHDHARIERTAALLSRQFRHDIHQAESVSIDDPLTDAPLLSVVLSNQRLVTYRLGKGGVLRQQPRDNDQTHREFYAFPEDHVIRIRMQTDPPRAVLMMDRDSQLIGVVPQVKLHVEAVIGLLLQPVAAEEGVQ